MKVIQSYIPYQHPDTIIDRDFAYLMMLSLLSAKKFYENVTLYTNKTQANFLKEMEFDYIFETETLSHIDQHIWIMPKLLVCKNQVEPFIHIDIDTILTKNINRNSDIYFAHHDITPKKITDISINKLSDFKRYWEILNFCRTYFASYFEYGVDKFIPIEEIRIDKIPNMSIIGVNEYDLFSNAIEKTLDLYKIEKSKYDRGSLKTAVLLEQFCIPHFMNQIKDVEFDFITKNNPFNLEDKNQYLHMNTHIKNLPYFHIGGKRREDPFFKGIIIKMLIDGFGVKYISNIFNFYKSYFQEKSIKNEPTIGEIEYEKLTGERLFTDMGYKNFDYLI